MSSLKNIFRSDKGFSLLELVTVVVIIGVLVAIAIPVYREGVEKKARETTDAANVQALNSATSIWVSEDPENNDPRALDTDSLRPLIEDHLIQGWPDSPPAAVTYS